MKDFKITERYTPSSGKSFRRYLQEVDKHKVLTSDQESELFEKIKAGDKVARERVINSNLRFVISVSKAYSVDPEIFIELVAAGNLGLVDAVEKFDHTKGFKFISYAVWHIRKEILKFLNESLRTIKIPANKLQELRAIEESEAKLLSKYGRTPTIEEIVEFMKESKDHRFKEFNVDLYRSVIQADKKPISLQASVSLDSDSTTWIEVIQSKSESLDIVESRLDNEVIATKLDSLLKKLDPKEIDIVSSHHGLNSNGTGETFQSIAERFGVSLESIRQKYHRAMKKMKFSAKRKGMRKEDFLVL